MGPTEGLGRLISNIMGIYCLRTKLWFSILNKANHKISNFIRELFFLKNSVLFKFLLVCFGGIFQTIIFICFAQPENEGDIKPKFEKAFPSNMTQDKF